ncbi:MAG: hypothetical protein IKF19_00515 [Bacilli bacterium]|nr:hypothetical protein [Bacilli bacterium]
MTQNVTTYYIPQNLNIRKGKIYTLYLNKITNLDLSGIITNDSLRKKDEITLTKDDYNKLLLLLDTSIKLYNQSQDLVAKIGRGRSK